MRAVRAACLSSATATCSPLSERYFTASGGRLAHEYAKLGGLQQSIHVVSLTTTPCCATNNGAPGRIRTCNHALTRGLLNPLELRGRRSPLLVQPGSGDRLSIARLGVFDTRSFSPLSACLRRASHVRFVLKGAIVTRKWACDQLVLLHLPERCPQRLDRRRELQKIENLKR